MIISVITASLQDENINKILDNFISHNMRVFVIKFNNDFLNVILKSFHVVL